MTTALVLGAGGPLGWVFHLGVVEALRERDGADPAGFDRILGTSAGAAIAAGLGSGATTAETLAALTTPPTEEDMARMREVRDQVRTKPWRVIRPLRPRLITKSLSAPVTAAVGMLPRGVFPTGPLRSVLDRDVDGWPANVWIPAVRVRDGELVVFGRDDVGGPFDLADAVEASSAVPVMFQPKAIGGESYVDGGVASATNTGQLVGEGFDTIVVSSVASRDGRSPARMRARRQLNQEIAALEAAGTRTVVLTPTVEFAALASGFPRRNGDRAAEIVDAARQVARTQLDASGLALS
ncbi:MAG: patatin-like phospholipase family protein [Actinomycetota bacterium]